MILSVQPRQQPSPLLPEALRSIVRSCRLIQQRRAEMLAAARSDRNGRKKVGERTSRMSDSDGDVTKEEVTEEEEEGTGRRRKMSGNAANTANGEL